MSLKVDSRTGFYATTRAGDKAGLALFQALGRNNFADRYEARQVLSGVVRQAKKLLRIGEELCNGPDDRYSVNWNTERYERWQSRLEAEDARVTARMTKLVSMLPEIVGVDASRISWQDRSPYCVVIVAVDELGVSREVLVSE